MLLPLVLPAPSPRSGEGWGEAKTTFSTFKSFKKVVDELKRKIDLICSG
jgi:hypothetical protein